MSIEESAVFGPFLYSLGAMSEVSRFLEQLDCIWLQAANRWMYEVGVARFQTKITLEAQRPVYFFWEWQPSRIFAVNYNRMAANEEDDDRGRKYSLSRIEIGAARS